MPFTSRVPRRSAPLLIAVLAASLSGSACGKVEADRDAIAEHLGRAASAYRSYVATPSGRGQLGPNSAPTEAANKRAAKAAKFALLELEAARNEAAPDQEFATFAQKTAAAGASINAIETVLRTGRPNKSLIAGGTASLASLAGAARDAGLTVRPQRVDEADLAHPPAA